MPTLPVAERHDKGMIHFTDGTRMSFDPGTSGLSNPYGLFPVRGSVITHAHYVAAATYIVANHLTD